MRSLPISSGFFLLLLSVPSLAQVDIYQSEAYSVEEMCAREAEQTDTTDYSSAYENCIKKNQTNPMYHSDLENGELHAQGDDVSKGQAMESQP